MLLFIMCSLVGEEDAVDIYDLHAQGSYKSIIALHEVDDFAEDQMYLWWHAHLALGHYQDVQERLEAAGQLKALTWNQNEILYRSYHFLGQRQKMILLQQRAEKAFLSDAEKTAADLSSIAHILADRNIRTAWDCIQQAHHKNQQYLPAYMIGAEISLRAFSFQNAFDELKLIVDKPYSRAQALTMLARVYLGQGDYAKANKTLKIARELNPFLQAAINLQTLLALQRHRDEDVIRLLKKSQRINPVDSETLAMQAAWHDASARDALRDDSIARILE
ncbi:MAG: hypothetical protein HRU15_13325, partial [Planctomycetes bacterium]|nr:hypothetical protein [Planctomycetota bacterium]